MNPIYASMFVMSLIGLGVIILFFVIRHEDKQQKPPTPKSSSH